ncbi:hypothetical protein AB1Y20_004961 [Prymnesium parvum]|uniref:Uncharacterized protein n=1 Tax=Prymnesium parvum TaxID=97485 RepID=A0AB34J557_PRYPA
MCAVLGVNSTPLIGLSQTPLLLLHASNDTDILPQEAANLHQAAMATGRRSRLLFCEVSSADRRITLTLLATNGNAWPSAYNFVAAVNINNTAAFRCVFHRIHS